jgi:hypothetical protein
MESKQPLSVEQEERAIKSCVVASQRAHNLLVLGLKVLKYTQQRKESRAEQIEIGYLMCISALILSKYIVQFSNSLGLQSFNEEEGLFSRSREALFGKLRDKPDPKVIESFFRLFLVIREQDVPVRFRILTKVKNAWIHLIFIQCEFGLKDDKLGIAQALQRVKHVCIENQTFLFPFASDGEQDIEAVIENYTSDFYNDQVYCDIYSFTEVFRPGTRYLPKSIDVQVWMGERLNFVPVDTWRWYIYSIGHFLNSNDDDQKIVDLEIGEALRELGPFALTTANKDPELAPLIHGDKNALKQYAEGIIKEEVRLPRPFVELMAISLGSQGTSEFIGRFKVRKDTLRYGAGDVYQDTYIRTDGAIKTLCKEKHEYVTQQEIEQSWTQSFKSVLFGRKMPATVQEIPWEKYHFVESPPSPPPPQEQRDPSPVIQSSSSRSSSPQEDYQSANGSQQEEDFRSVIGEESRNSDDFPVQETIESQSIVDNKSETIPEKSFVPIPDLPIPDLEETMSFQRSSRFEPATQGGRGRRGSTRVSGRTAQLAAAIPQTGRPQNPAEFGQVQANVQHQPPAFAPLSPQAGFAHKAPYHEPKPKSHPIEDVSDNIATVEVPKDYLEVVNAKLQEPISADEQGQSHFTRIADLANHASARLPVPFNTNERRTIEKEKSSRHVQQGPGNHHLTKQEADDIRKARMKVDLLIGTPAKDLIHAVPHVPVPKVQEHTESPRVKFLQGKEGIAAAAVAAKLASGEEPKPAPKRSQKEAVLTTSASTPKPVVSIAEVVSKSVDANIAANTKSKRTERYEAREEEKARLKEKKRLEEIAALERSERLRLEAERLEKEKQDKIAAEKRAAELAELELRRKKQEEEDARLHAEHEERVRKAALIAEQQAEEKRFQEEQTRIADILRLEAEKAKIEAEAAEAKAKEEAAAEKVRFLQEQERIAVATAEAERQQREKEEKDRLEAERRHQEEVEAQRQRDQAEIKRLEAAAKQAAELAERARLEEEVRLAREQAERDAKLEREAENKRRLEKEQKAQEDRKAEEKRLLERKNSAQEMKEAVKTHRENVANVANLAKHVNALADKVQRNIQLHNGDIQRREDERNAAIQRKADEIQEKNRQTQAKLEELRQTRAETQKQFNEAAREAERHRAEFERARQATVSHPVHVVIRPETVAHPPPPRSEPIREVHHPTPSGGDHVVTHRRDIPHVPVTPPPVIYVYNAPNRPLTHEEKLDAVHRVAREHARLIMNRHGYNTLGTVGNVVINGGEIKKGARIGSVGQHAQHQGIVGGIYHSHHQ